MKTSVTIINGLKMKPVKFIYESKGLAKILIKTRNYSGF